MRSLIIYTSLWFGVILLSGCSTPMTQDHQNADAVYLNLEEEYQLNEDGSQQFSHRHKLKLLTHASFNQMYGESFIVYNPAFQKLTIKKAETLKTDGKVVVSGDNAMNLILPGYASSSKAHNHLREMVVSHLGTEIGAVLNLDYQIESADEFNPALMHDITLARKSPVKKMKIRVKVPMGVVLSYRLLNVEGEPIVRKEKGMKEYIWTFYDLPSLSDEVLVDRNSHIPRIILSTVDGGKVAGLGKVLQGFNYGVSSEMKEVADEIVKDCSDLMDKTLALQQFVFSKIALVKVPYSIMGYRCRSVEDIWQANSGTLVEKALILTALLNAEGISAEVVGLFPGFVDKEDVPNLVLLNEFLVRVELSDGPLFLSAVESATHNLMLDRDSGFAWGMNSGKIYEFKPGSSNRVVLNGEFNVDESKKIEGKVQLLVEGANCPCLQLRDNASIASELIHFKGSKQSRIEELSNSSVKVNYDLKTPHSLKMDSYFLWRLPWSKNGVDAFNIPVLTPERSTQSVLTNLLEEECRYNIHIAEGIRLVNPQFSLRDSTRIAVVDLSIECKGDSVVVVRKLKLKEKVIPCEEFGDFYRILNIWRDPKYKELVFCEL